jgi:hypothetical protein
VLIGALIAFPAGVIVGNNGSSPTHARDKGRPGATVRRGSPGRDVYSPNVATDPYVLEQQRKMLEALEANCRQLDLYCTQAQQARARITEAEARQ